MVIQEFEKSFMKIAMSEENKVHTGENTAESLNRALRCPDRTGRQMVDVLLQSRGADPAGPIPLQEADHSLAIIGR